MKLFKYSQIILVLFIGFQNLIYSQEFDYEKSEAISSIQAMIVTEEFINAYHTPEADGFAQLEILPFLGLAVCFDLPMRWISEDTKLLFGGGGYAPITLRNIADDPDYNFSTLVAPFAGGFKTKIKKRPLSVVGGSTLFIIPDKDDISDSADYNKEYIPFVSIKFDGNLIFQKLYLNTKFGSGLALYNDLAFKFDKYNSIELKSGYLYGYQYFPSSLFLRFDWNNSLYFDNKRIFPDFIIPSIIYKSYGYPSGRNIFPDSSYDAFGIGLQYHMQITKYPVYIIAEAYYHLSLLFGCSLGCSMKPFTDEANDGFFIASLHYNQFWNKTYPEEQVSLWPYLSFTFNFVIPTNTFNDYYGGDW